MRQSLEWWGKRRFFIFAFFAFLGTSQYLALNEKAIELGMSLV